MNIKILLLYKNKKQLAKGEEKKRATEDASWKIPLPFLKSLGKGEVREFNFRILFVLFCFVLKERNFIWFGSKSQDWIPPNCLSKKLQVTQLFDVQNFLLYSNLYKKNFCELYEKKF